ncbi:MAG: hypothetical protein U9Q03_04880 [Patescibacteria group bacterium]|nr:hypothetical protein [Patescibacteria group bacterium]
MDASVSGGPEGGGVMLMVPENDDESWQNVPIVNRNTDSGKVNLNANWHSNDNSDYSVPSARECLPAQRTPMSAFFAYRIDLSQPPVILPMR